MLPGQNQKLTILDFIPIAIGRFLQDLDSVLRLDIGINFWYKHILQTAPVQ